MSAQTFTSILPQIRDRGMSLPKSWEVRHDTEGGEHYFELWSITPFSKVTAEDILWCLVAAAVTPEATHLRLHVFTGNPIAPTNPRELFRLLLKQLLDEFGFKPEEFAYRFSDPGGDFSILFSLFSEDESIRVGVLNRS